MKLVSKSQGCSVCLLELPVCLAQGVIWERVVKVSYSQLITPFLSTLRHEYTAFKNIYKNVRLTLKICKLTCSSNVAHGQLYACYSLLGLIEGMTF